MNNASLEYQRFEDIDFDIVTQVNILKEKREKIDSSFHGGELTTVWMMDSWSAADSLQRREDEVISNCKVRYDIDKSIVDLYLKVLSVQASKVHFIMNKLEQLSKKSGDDPCPADFTIHAYQEWSRTCPRIHALQSQILDLLGQKMKLFNMATQEVKHTRSFTHDTVDIEKLRSQTYFFVERDPVVDTDFTLHVSNIVNVNSNTFEAKKIREFIHQCWDSSEAEMKEMNFAKYYQEFVGALTEHILTKFGHMRRSGNSKVDVTRDQIYVIIEAALIPHVSDCIFERDASDDIISEQYKKFSSLAQTGIGITREYVDNSEAPYRDAIFQLRCMSVVKLPTQKMRAIILSAHSTINRMGEICLNADVVAGADEFIDVWVYVVLQAGVTNLCSNIKFLREFCNPSYMLSETGYYLSSLELASEYIKNLKFDSLIGGAEQTSQVLFVSEMSSKLKKLCERENWPFEIVEENFELAGYEMVLCSDWFNNPCRLVHSAFREASKAPPIFVSLCQFKKAISLESVHKLLFQSSPQVTLRLAKINKTNIFVPILTVCETNSNDVTVLPRYVRICGKRKRDNLSLISYYNLTALGIRNSRQTKLIEEEEDLEKDLQSMNAQFKEDYSACLTDPACLADPSSPADREQDVNNIIKLIEDSLKSLGFYSLLLPSTGRYSVGLQKAVRMFQRDCNQIFRAKNDYTLDRSTERSPKFGTTRTQKELATVKLREDGINDVKTLLKILERAKKYPTNVKKYKF